jgi:hypothetical protein
VGGITTTGNYDRLQVTSYLVNHWNPSILPMGFQEDRRAREVQVVEGELSGQADLEIDPTAPR